MPITNSSKAPRHRSTSHSPSPRSSKRPRAEIKAEPKLEMDNQRLHRPLLIPFFGGPTQRFHTTVGMDLSREYVDLTGSGAPSRIPVSLIPQADIATMSRLPIVQDPADPTKEHPSLPQPARLNPRMQVKTMSHGATLEALNAARAHMDDMLQNPAKRRSYENSNFKLEKIKPKHLSKSGSSFTPNHPTLNMRGVVATKNLKAGSTLQYNAQYMSKSEWDRGVSKLSHKLQVKTHMASREADKEAQRLLTSYSWKGIKYKGKDYEVSAFGAGNVTAMINHDDRRANMGVSYSPPWIKKAKLHRC